VVGDYARSAGLAESSYFLRKINSLPCVKTVRIRNVQGKSRKNDLKQSAVWRLAKEFSLLAVPEIPQSSQSSATGSSPEGMQKTKEIIF